MKKTQILLFTAFIFVGCFYFSNFVFSRGLSWTQDSWNGGSGQNLWSDSTKYASAENASTTASGIMLATNSGWYDSSWKYRQSVSITNNSESVLTDYQVPIYLNTSSLITGGKMKNDCGDIRITDAEGAALPFWIVSAPTANICNTESTKIWIKVSSIPTSGTTLYIYYGNNTASGVSNGNEVFSIFGDFTSGSSLPSGWVKTDVGTSGTASVGSGVLSISNTNGVDVWMRSYGATHVYNSSTFSGSFVAEALLNSQTNSDPWAKTGITVQNAVSAGVGNGQAFIIATPGNGMAFQYQSEAGDPCDGGDCTAPNSQVNSGSSSFPMFLKLTKDGSNQISGYYGSDGSNWTQRGGVVTPWGATTSQYITLFVTPHSVSGTSVATYSFFYVRSFTSSEPTVGSPQNEELPYKSSSNLISSVFDTENVVDFGTLAYSVLAATNTEVVIRARTSDESDMSGADDFTSCDPINSGDDISSNNCVSDRQRYIQYQVALSSSDNLFTPALKDITINYSLTPLYTLSYLAADNGFISGSSTQSVYLGNDGSGVTAVPNAGYHFVDWSDGATVNPRTDTNITENVSLTANFERNHGASFIPPPPPQIQIAPVLGNDGSINYQASNVYQMAVSETEDFAGVSWEPYSELYKNYNKVLYIKFRSKDGGVSDVYKIEPKQNTADNINEENIHIASEIIGGNNTSSPVIGKTSYNFTRNLEKGMVGEDVLELQKYLNNHSFLLSAVGMGASGQETIYFGTLTKQALIKFQQFFGLPAYGFFGPLTRKLIMQ